jgi:hypothetical protein
VRGDKEEDGEAEDMSLGVSYTQGGGRAEFRRILQRFEDAEKEDMRMIQRTLDKVRSGHGQKAGRETEVIVGYHSS